MSVGGAALVALVLHAIWLHLKRSSRFIDWASAVFVVATIVALVSLIVGVAQSALGAELTTGVVTISNTPSKQARPQIEWPAGDGCNWIRPTGNGYGAMTLMNCGDRQPLDDVQMKRRDLANRAFEFLKNFARPLPEDPTQWEDGEGPYNIHRAAKQIYELGPLKDIVVPVSVWERGGYTWRPDVWVTHQALLAEIYWLIIFGKQGMPPHQARP